MNRDLLNNARPDDVARSTIAVLDKLQDMPPHVAMTAVCALFLSLSEHWKMPAQDVFTATINLMNGVDGKRPEFAAVQQYIQEEL